MSRYSAQFGLKLNKKKTQPLLLCKFGYYYCVVNKIIFPDKIFVILSRSTVLFHQESGLKRKMFGKCILILINFEIFKLWKGFQFKKMFISDFLCPYCSFLSLKFIISSLQVWYVVHPIFHCLFNLYKQTSNMSNLVAPCNIFWFTSRKFYLWSMTSGLLTNTITDGTQK